MGRFTHTKYHDKFTLGVERVHDVVQQYPLLSRRWVDLQIGTIMINSLLNDCTLIFSSGLLVVSNGSAETLKSAIPVQNYYNFSLVCH
jgi:hypothetical protein